MFADDDAEGKAPDAAGDKTGDKKGDKVKVKESLSAEDKEKKIKE